MAVPKGVLIGVGVALLAAGGIAGTLLISDDEDEAAVAPTTTSTTEVATTTSSAPDSTTTTIPADSTTTTATRRTRTTRVATSTTSTTGGPTTSVASATCGTGRASVAFGAKDLQTDAEKSTFVPQAIVDNQVTAPIEVEAIVIDVVYPGNVVRTVNFATAGTVIAPGTSATFSGERLTTPKRYEGARITRFTYVTSGRPDACRVSAP
ncbi:MAG: hypothetical protein M3Q48_14415 [Actinomycetota bacterium]|nr:hypothetical protein [Actinomycetota bacterium]